MTEQKSACRNGCGIDIYFDAQRKSASGKSIPLEMRNGVKSGEPHNCPNSPFNQKNKKSATFGGKSMQDAVQDCLAGIEALKKRVDNLEIDKWRTPQ